MEDTEEKIAKIVALEHATQTRESVRAKTEVEQLDELLAVLRKHSVAEFKQRDMHVRFYAEPTLEEAQKVIGRELERALRTPPNNPTPDEIGKHLESIRGEEAKPIAEPGAVEVTRFPIEDVLHGAK